MGTAEVCVAEGKLLGHSIGRHGSAPDPERCQAVTDFPPLKEKLHIQQFLGCANWLRGHLPAEYGHAAKILGQCQKPCRVPSGWLGILHHRGMQGLHLHARAFPFSVLCTLFFLYIHSVFPNEDHVFVLCTKTTVFALPSGHHLCQQCCVRDAGSSITQDCWQECARYAPRPGVKCARYAPRPGVKCV